MRYLRHNGLVRRLAGTGMLLKVNASKIGRQWHLSPANRTGFSTRGMIARTAEGNVDGEMKPLRGELVVADLPTDVIGCNGAVIRPSRIGRREESQHHYRGLDTHV